jgi:hypothetical protein
LDLVFSCRRMNQEVDQSSSSQRDMRWIFSGWRIDFW